MSREMFASQIVSKSKQTRYWTLFQSRRIHKKAHAYKDISCYGTEYLAKQRQRLGCNAQDLRFYKPFPLLYAADLYKFVQLIHKYATTPEPSSCKPDNVVQRSTSRSPSLLPLCLPFAFRSRPICRRDTHSPRSLCRRRFAAVFHNVQLFILLQVSEMQYFVNAFYIP